MKTETNFVMTNTCNCQTYDENLGDFVPAPECWGDCWDCQVEDFTEVVEHLFTENKQAFRITGFPVWDGTVDGSFFARNAEELLEAITPSRTEWFLDIIVYQDHLTGSLSHHDGRGVITVTPINCTHDWTFIDGQDGEMECLHCGDTQN